MTVKERDELLIRLDERTLHIDKDVGRIDVWCTNHLAHHFRYGIMAWGIALTATAALVVALSTR